MDRYALKLEGYGISAERYRELEYFCYQYTQKRKALRSMARAMQAAGSDPTPRWEKTLRDLRDIERAALDASEGNAFLATALIQYVTCREKPPIETVPCGRRQFYDARRRFFCTLDDLR